jgi:uncharacterized RmlC-like cupin family protein
MNRVALSLVFLSTAVTIDAVSTVSPVQVWSATEIGKTAVGLAQQADAEDLAGKTLGSFGNHSTAIWTRARSGKAELHKAKTDLIVVTDGEATLLYGGSIPDAKATSAVETRGSSISGGVSRKIGPGDIIRIPAGTPHQFILAKGRTLSYFAIKIARQ